MLKRNQGLLGWILVGCLLMLSGCSGEKEPEPTADPSAYKTLEGTISLEETDSAYRVECKSNIPNGAYVVISLVDENGDSILSEGDILQKQGKAEISFPRAEVQEMAQIYGSKIICARLEFYPAEAVQPREVQESYGEKGSLLVGDNVNLSELNGTYYAKLQSETIRLEQEKKEE